MNERAVQQTDDADEARQERERRVMVAAHRWAAVTAIAGARRAPRSLSAVFEGRGSASAVARAGKG